jgi:hypothetical protein
VKGPCTYRSDKEALHAGVTSGGSWLSGFELLAEATIVTCSLLYISFMPNVKSILSFQDQSSIPLNFVEDTCVLLSIS